MVGISNDGLIDILRGNCEHVMANDNAWDAHGGGLLVVAAHPDDETIGCAGLIGRVHRVHVAHLTDGVPADCALRPPAFRHDGEALRSKRASELRRALVLNGVLEEQLIQLGATDQEASYEMPLLVQRLLAVIEEVRPTVVITHPYEGGHPDHDAAAFVVRAACMVRRKRGAACPAVLEMTSYHGRSGRLTTGEFLESAPNADNVPTFAIDLSPEERRRKAAMMRCFDSQKAVLAPFGIDAERFRLAPRYDFSTPPHDGPLYYEQLGWPLTGRRWRELARDARKQLFESL
jgi:N-acetylglucosamine malate deacetylase 2